MKSLSTYANKQSAKNAIFTLTAEMSRGFFQDIGWGNVRAIFTAINNAGGSVNVLKSEYFRNDGNYIAGKVWFLEVTCGEFALLGTLHASFREAGDLASAYDLALQLS